MNIAETMDSREESEINYYISSHKKFYKHGRTGTFLARASLCTPLVFPREVVIFKTFYPTVANTNCTLTYKHLFSSFS